MPLEADGTAKVFAAYQEARADLISRLDECCSYCGMHLDASLAIEHVKPKSLNPGLATSWENLLLACPNCNSHKGDVDLDLAQYLWPDVDNTDYAFKYGPGALVQVSSELDGADASRAQNALDLVALDVLPAASPTVSDRRWINREESWDLAVKCLGRLSRCDCPELRETIAELAYKSGYWSVWISVFRGDEDMRLRLIDCIKGTAKHGTARAAYDGQGVALENVNR